MSVKTETILYRGFRGEADFPCIVDIINGSKEADENERATSVESVANDYKHLHNCDPFTDMVFVEVDGQTVGYGRCWWHEQLDGLHLYNFFAHLLPEWRSQGIRREMLHKLEARLHQIARDHPAEQEKLLQAWGSDTETHWTALLEDEGYEIVRYGLEMVRPNLENIPDCPVPEGIEIRGGTQAEWTQIWYAAREAFRDHWGATEWSEEQLEQRQIEPTFNPPLWRVAWAGDTVAGGVLNFIDAAENEEYGRKRGYTETIFVRRPWRGQGLAQALISRSFLALKEADMEEAALGLDADNISGALHLYRKMGFQENKRFMTYRKPL